MTILKHFEVNGHFKSTQTRQFTTSGPNWLQDDCKTVAANEVRYRDVIGKFNNNLLKLLLRANYKWFVLCKIGICLILQVKALLI